jgi:hypothetical protein
MFLPNPRTPLSQAPRPTDQTFGIGLTLQKPLEIKRLTPRERALLAFAIAGARRDLHAALH